MIFLIINKELKPPDLDSNLDSFTAIIVFHKHSYNHQIKVNTKCKDQDPN